LGRGSSGDVYKYKIEHQFYAIKKIELESV